MIRALVLSSAAALAVLCTAGPALGGDEETSRAEFIRAADNVCRDYFKRSEPYFRRGNKLVKNEQFAAGARKYRRGTRVLLTAVEVLRRLPRPSGDEKKLERWLDLQARSLKISNVGWSELGDQREQTQETIRRAIEVGRRAQRVVRDYGFEVCA